MIEIEDSKRIFEIRAYRKAALTLETMQEDVADILEKKGMEGLMELQGIGEGLAKKIKEYVETGRMKKYDEYKKKYPFDLYNLTKIQGLGPRKAFRLYSELGVRNVKDLKKVIMKQKVRKLEGFGERSEKEMAKGIAMFESGSERMLLGTALPEAEAIVGKLLKSGFVQRAEVAGSSRRMRETVGDIDILAISDKPEKVKEFVSKMKEVESAISSGPTKTTVRLRIGLNCDIRVLKRESFGAAMQYFIGSKAHNVKMRQIAIRKGYKLNEYGLFDKRERSVAGEEEKEVYAKLGLDYMEPEMREDRGEIELAMEHKVPRLVQLNDIRGDLHMHTVYTDGLNTIEEMVKEAVGIGREYIGFTDHSKSEYQAHGMDDRRYAEYSREIDSMRKKYDGRIEILKSSEVDILKDGSLDFSRKSLEMMDYVLASVHTNLNMPREEMTKRIIKCLEGGMVDIMAHPTDRLINQRPPINADWDRIFDVAEKQGVVMEIDSAPERLDLNDENIFRARSHNLRFSIDTDSHRTGHMRFMRFGIGTAKRGWVVKEEVINARGYKDILKVLGR